MKSLLKSIVVACILIVLIVSCQKDDPKGDKNVTENDDEQIDPDKVISGIEVTYVKNNTTQTILISENIGSWTSVDEVDGVTVKRLGVSTGLEETYPKISMDLPYSEVKGLFSTTYGNEERYPDYFSIDFSEEDVYSNNVDAQDKILEEYIEPWYEVLSISESGEVVIAFGGTFIKYPESGGEYQSIYIEKGTFKVMIEDDYSSVQDNSLPIANPPIGSSNSNNGDGSNIVLDFSIRKPLSYTTNGEMLYDTVTLKMEVTNSNAVRYKWELTQGDYYYSDNYFLHESPSKTFSKNVKLRNLSDTCDFTVKLTGYDKDGNSKSISKSVSVPMLKTRVFYDGIELKVSGPVYYKINDETTVVNGQSSSNNYIDIRGLEFALLSLDDIRFTNFNKFPATTALGDICQTDQYSVPVRNGENTFFIGGYNTRLSDPDCNFSNLLVDNYTIQHDKNAYYKIFGLLHFTFKLKGDSKLHELEIYHLASGSMLGVPGE